MIGAHGDHSPSLYPAAFYGFRRWTLRTPDDGPMELRSPHYDFSWRRPEYAASCLTVQGALKKHEENAPHRPPEHDCQCGFYSYFEVPEPSHYWGFWGYTVGNLIGLIVATGKIQLHETGMRSERVKVIALTPTREDDLPKLERFLAQPGWEAVHIVPVDELPALAPEFGSPVPANEIEAIRKRNLAKREEARQRAEIKRRKEAEAARRKQSTPSVLDAARWMFGSG